jgi:hypothetical protein
MHDPRAKRTMVNLALSYEHLAKHARLREESEAKECTIPWPKRPLLEIAKTYDQITAIAQTRHIGKPRFPGPPCRLTFAVDDLQQRGTKMLGPGFVRTGTHGSNNYDVEINPLRSARDRLARIDSGWSVSGKCWDRNRARGRVASVPFGCATMEGVIVTRRNTSTQFVFPHRTSSGSSHDTDPHASCCARKTQGRGRSGFAPAAPAPRCAWSSRRR